MTPDRTTLAADRARALEITPVSREIVARLDQFVDLLLQRRQQLNLIAASTAPIIWTRHIADSLQLLDLAPHAKVWIDLGSGAGFPGLVIASALADEPEARVHLIESNVKKAAFLREAAALVGVIAQVHAARIETFAETFSARADVITARALAPLQETLALAYPLSKTGAQGLFLKGQDVGSELTQASKYWKFEPVLVPSKTSPDSRIVSVRHWEPRRRRP